MSSKKAVFFDLDGTLINSAPGILHAVRYALEAGGHPIPPESEMTRFIGPPLLEGFSRIAGLSLTDAARAVDNYRVCYRAGAIFECEVYEGIRELLTELYAEGIPLVLATCKPHVFAKRILDHFNLTPLFTLLSGPEIDGTRGRKHEVIAHAMQLLDIKAPSDVLMVGDRADDVLGAKENGIACAGVLWGFGSRRELEEAGAASILETPSVLYSEIQGFLSRQ